MTSDLISLLTPSTRIKVSSDKSGAKKHLIDNDPETCWTSQQDLPQYIQLTFPTLVLPKRISFTFQGGFVGKRCSVNILPPTNPESAASGPEWQLLTQIYPEDVNRRQSFDLPAVEPGIEDQGVSSVKLVFDESSDFFGRITLYELKLDGLLLDK